MQFRRATRDSMEGGVPVHPLRVRFLPVPQPGYRCGQVSLKYSVASMVLAPIRPWEERIPAGKLQTVLEGKPIKKKPQPIGCGNKIWRKKRCLTKK